MAFNKQISIFVFLSLLLCLGISLVFEYYGIKYHLTNNKCEDKIKYVLLDVLGIIGIGSIIASFAIYIGFRYCQTFQEYINIIPVAIFFISVAFYTTGLGIYLNMKDNECSVHIPDNRLIFIGITVFLISIVVIIAIGTQTQESRSCATEVRTATLKLKDELKNTIELHKNMTNNLNKEHKENLLKKDAEIEKVRKEELAKLSVCNSNLAKKDSECNSRISDLEKKYEEVLNKKYSLKDLVGEIALPIKSKIQQSPVKPSQPGQPSKSSQPPVIMPFKPVIRS